MSELVEKRIAFAICVGKLLAFCEKFGYRAVLCEVMRTPMQSEWNATHCSWKDAHGRRCERELSDAVHSTHVFRPIGIRGSLHQNGLAIDLLLMAQGQDGSWMIDDREDGYRAMADYWKTLHAEACAGIDFGDSGHFSLAYNGRK